MMRRSKTVVKPYTAVFVSAFLIAFSAPAPTVLAQQPAAVPAAAPAVAGAPAAATPDNPLMVLWKAGMDAFNSGDFKLTISNFQNVIKQAPKDAQLEPVYYTLGAAYFNTQDFKAAADTFAKLLALYPQTTRAMDVTFSMAQANMLAGNNQVAAQLFKQLESSPQYKLQIPLLLASSYKDAGKIEEAVTTLEKMVLPGIQSTAAAKGAMMLIDLYVTRNEVDKAAALLVNVNNHIGFVENVAALNSLAVNTGDKCLLLKKNAAAIGCYRVARSKEQVKEIQEERIASMERQCTTNSALLQENSKDPNQVMRLNRLTATIKAEIANSQKLLEEIDKLPSIIPPLYMRIASAFFEDGQRWQSLVVYSDLMRRFPKSPEMEAALYASIVTFAEINQPKRSLALCEQYVKTFPQGPNLATIIYFQGNIALQSADYTKAESFFGTLLKDHSDSPLAEQVRFLLGNSKFQQGRFKEAANEYIAYIKQFPGGSGVEEANYRLAVSILFDGSITDALPLIANYLQKFPQGQFVPDAKYRLMVCLFSNKEYDNVISSSKAWETQFPGDQQLGEVLALEADSHAAKDETDVAIKTYIRSYKVAVTDEVLNYSLFEASKLLQKRNDWEQISSMFEEFVKDKPDNDSVTTALFWIGKAKAKLGKPDEAKAFLAETVKKYIDNPQREAVEQIISQLAMLCTKRKPAAQPLTTGTDAAPTPPPTPTPAPVDPGVELEGLLTGGTTATAKARVLYAKAELCRMRKQTKQEDEYLLEIADVSKPEDLSAILLGVVADRLVANGRQEKAIPLYNYLMAEYPKSDLIDFAYVGLGDIAFLNKDYSKALNYYKEGIDSSPAGAKMRDLSLGQAKSLLAMDQLEESKKIFLDISARREWRGEATATSVFSLGEIEMKGGHYPEAIAYYQRVFVGYQKFLPWVAKAYIQSAACFLKLGKTQEAINTYKELLRNEKLRSFPETEIARKAVEAAGDK